MILAAFFPMFAPRPFSPPADRMANLPYNIKSIMATIVNMV